MSLLAKLPYISPEDYLDGEAQSDIKHEYRYGQVWAMGGATRAHRAICFSLHARLRAHLRESGCWVDGLDARLNINEKNIFYYPDLMVTCEHVGPQSLSIESPKVIVEVLSTSTADLDRTTKFADYAAIPSLEEYVLVDSRARAAWVYRRSEGWALEEIPREGALRLKSLDFQCAMDEIYEDVDLGDTTS